MRAKKSVAGHMMVFLCTNRFKEGPQYNNSISTTLFPPTAYTPDMIRVALKLLEELYLEGFEYKKAGVMLADIMHEDDVPLSFIETNYLDDGRARLMKAIDRINKAHGRDTVYIASSGSIKNGKCAEPGSVHAHNFLERYTQGEIMLQSIQTAQCEQLKIQRSEFLLHFSGEEL